MAGDDAVLGAVHDVDPVFIRGQRAVERPDGQIIEAPGESGIGVAARLQLTVHFDGPPNRDTVPTKHLDTPFERGITTVGCTYRLVLTGGRSCHDESLNVVVETLLDEEWQIGGAVSVGFRQEVQGV
jgi:hypothetical protein